MKKLIFGLIATIIISFNSFAQESKIISSSFSQSKSDVEIPSELKSKNVWTEENADQFVTFSVYKKEYQAFISITLDLKDPENVKIASINIPNEVKESGSFNPTQSLRKVPCWTRKCVVEAIIDWFNSLFD